MKSVHYFACICLIILCNSCCNNLDCVYDSYSQSFRVLQKNNRRDLLFGQYKIYDKSKLKFYLPQDTGTIVFDYRFVNYSEKIDSVVQVDFKYPVKMAYVEFGDGDIDTLNISHKSDETQCCGTITYVGDVTVNDKNNTSQGIVLILKDL